ncbi:MAG: hypothetical protein IKU58_06225 [Clostridia bacterium]|nr:hypothetical protein [Clostridia bacterium]
MDKLKFGSLELQGTAMSTVAWVGGMSVPALELRVEGPLDGAALAAAAQNDLEIYGEDGTLQGTHSGYHTVTRHSLVLAKVTDLQQELMDTRTALEQVEREHAALLFESLTGEVLA